MSINKKTREHLELAHDEIDRLRSAFHVLEKKIKDTEGELTAAYMAGFHKRDDEVRELEKDKAQIRHNTLIEIAEMMERHPQRSERTRLGCKYWSGRIRKMIELEAIDNAKENKG